MEHTPESWWVEVKHGPFGSEGPYMIRFANGDYVGEIYRLENANKTAAAPELLEACEDAYDWMTLTFGASELSDQLRAAITKAKGGG